MLRTGWTLPNNIPARTQSTTSHYFELKNNNRNVSHWTATSEYGGLTQEGEQQGRLQGEAHLEYTGGTRTTDQDAKP